MTNPKELNIKLNGVTPFAHYRNYFYTEESQQEPFAEVKAEINGAALLLTLPLDRSYSRELYAYTPQAGICAGKNNNAVLLAAGVSIDQMPAVYSELTRLVTEKLKNERTDDDMVAEGLIAHKDDICNMHEFYEYGDTYDGETYDPEDDFHKWLIENNFAEIETDDETGEKTLSLFGDWSDRLSDYFGNYFLSVQIANTDDGDALCVEADICIGGPTCYLRQFFGRGYTLVYSWGGLSESYEFDADLDDWLDDMLATWTGAY